MEIVKGIIRFLRDIVFLNIHINTIAFSIRLLAFSIKNWWFPILDISFGVIRSYSFFLFGTGISYSTLIVKRPVIILVFGFRVYKSKI